MKSTGRNKFSSNLVDMQLATCWVIESEHPIKHLMLYIHLHSMFCQFLQAKEKKKKKYKGALEISSLASM